MNPDPDPVVANNAVTGTNTSPLCQTKSQWWSYCLILGSAVASILILFRAFFYSRFDQIFSDPGDGRLCVTILEHWTNVFRWQCSAASPNFFFPAEGVLGYCDTLFLIAIPHAIARLLGFDRYIAFEIAIMTVSAIGFASMLCLLRRILHFELLLSLLGAYLFTCSNVYFVEMVHPQLTTVAFVPLLPILAVKYWRAREDKPALAKVYISLTGALLALILFTAFYIGWFAVLFLAAGLISYVICMTLTARTISPCRQAASKLWAKKTDLGIGLAICLVALIPLLSVYLPVLHLTGGRSISEALQYMTTPLGVFNVGPENLFWSKAATRLQEVIGADRLGELPAGWPFLNLCVFIASAGYGGLLLLRSRKADCPPEQRRWACLICALAISCFTLWLATTRFGDQAPLWLLLCKIVPGAKAIRVPQRINLVLNMGVVIVCVFGLRRLWQLLKQRYILAVIVQGVLALGLVGEQLNSKATHVISRTSEAQKFSRITPPPDVCSAFYVRSDDDHVYSLIRAQTDAMLVAQQFGIPTLNGYSGWTPEGWNLFTSGANLDIEVVKWAERNRLPAGICLLDLQTGRWSAVELPKLRQVHQTPREPLDGVLDNADFENDTLSPWASFQDIQGALSTDCAHSGSHSLTETGGHGSFYQDTKVLESGHTYWISACAMTPKGAAAGAYLAIFVPSANVATLSRIVRTRGNWELLVQPVTVSALTTIRIHLFRTEGSGTVHWDNVRVHREFPESAASSRKLP